MAIRFGIVTVSTTCFLKVKQDTAGPTLEDEISRSFSGSKVTFTKIISDDFEAIVCVLKEISDQDLCDVVFTVGGTGLSPSDVTPEATKAVIEKEAPGLSHVMLSRSLDVTDMAMLSRPVCGVRNKTLIINFPGSAKAALECLGFVKHSLPHAVDLLKERDKMVKKTHMKIQAGFAPVCDSKVKVKAGASRDRKSPYPMLEVKEAVTIILSSIAAAEDSESIPIEGALGRILAEDVGAQEPVPPFPASIKDGYAVKTSDGAGKRRVRGALIAGESPEISSLQPGEVVRISTGAAVPPGADAVVQIEDTTLVKCSDGGEEEEIVEINVAPKEGQDIRRIGSDIEKNTIVLKKYNRITAAYVGVLAMLGLSKVKVTKRPQIGIISTGNELVGPEISLKPGQIRDSNKITLLSLYKSFNYDAIDCGIAKDNPNHIKRTLEGALSKCDVVVSSGGVSMGEYDLIKQVLVEDFDANIHFGRLNMKPGKPTVFASLTYSGKFKVIFALPGNPVSCCVTSLLFVIPSLKYMESNKSFNGWPEITVQLKETITNRDVRPEYVRLKINQDADNKLVGISTGNQISSRLNSMVDANGLLLVPGKTTFEAGSTHLSYLFGPL